MRRLVACRPAFVLVAVVVGAAPATALAACHGMGTRPPRGAITSDNAARFSEDATILAARVAVGPWLCGQRAAKFDRDLKRIRARFPAVTDIHALPDFALDQILIEVDTRAPWFAQWASGMILTGDARVDMLLGRFQTAAIDSLFKGSASFVIRFSEPLNIPLIAKKFRSASPYFQVVQENGTVGDGNRITFQNISGRRTYTFSLGWGDCSAGCASRHFWHFTLLADGRIVVRESGTPIPSLPVLE